MSKGRTSGPASTVYSKCMQVIFWRIDWTEQMGCTCNNLTADQPMRYSSCSYMVGSGDRLLSSETNGTRVPTFMVQMSLFYYGMRRDLDQWELYRIVTPT